MKKTTLLTSASAFLLVAGLLVSGCKKDDTTPPVITLNGSSSMTISLNSTFTDPGATANDDKDGKVTPTVSGTVDKDTKGTYILTYSATDAAGNAGSATRTVIVANDAESWAGTYAVHDSAGPTTTFDYAQTVTTDIHVNNRVHFDKFADYANNNTIYGNVTGGGTTIDIPSQSVTGIGSVPSDNHTFSGTGLRSGNNFGLNYTDNNTTQVAVANDISIWIKQ